jgi:SulP family sulfate permease
MGFTGSYIFSQTIFTYRTGVHSRWIGVLICCAYMFVVVSTMNLLQIAPLFFLGSTLIFIGYDLLFEWLYEIRESILLSEYATIWGTFVAIQVVGVDAGIIIGVLFAVFENVVMTAQTTIVHRVRKRSRAVWSKESFKILQDHAYHSTYPKILVLELAGPVFFGSSQNVLNRLIEEIGIEQSQTEEAETLIKSPHTSSHLLTKDRKPSFFRNPGKATVLSRPPQFVVLDLAQVSNVDASAARACFLQFRYVAFSGIFSYPNSLF